MTNLFRYNEYVDNVLNEGISQGQAATIRDGFTQSPRGSTRDKFRYYSEQWYEEELLPFIKNGSKEEEFEKVATHGMNILHMPKKATMTKFMEIVTTKEFEKWMKEFLEKNPEDEDYRRDFLKNLQKTFKNVV